jgi:hypothetical protein
MSYRIPRNIAVAVLWGGVRSCEIEYEVKLQTGASTQTDLFFKLFHQLIPLVPFTFVWIPIKAKLIQETGLIFGNWFVVVIFNVPVVGEG